MSILEIMFEALSSLFSFLLHHLTNPFTQHLSIHSHSALSSKAALAQQRVPSSLQLG